MYSPGVIVAAVPTTVTRSRWPRTLTRRTQKPVSELWNVTRSTSPDRGSRSLASVGWDFATTVTSLRFFGSATHTRRNACDLCQPALLVFATSFSHPNTERPSSEADRFLSV